jgi:F-type H+-transporting ATPase subunit b
MSLLTPDSGLLFWMLLSFGIVVFVLTKFGFPVIIKMVEERKAYIEESLLMAEKARIELQQVKAEGEQIIATARNEHKAIIAEAAELKDKLVKDARAQAQVEADKVIAESRRLIDFEKKKLCAVFVNKLPKYRLVFPKKYCVLNLPKRESNKL